MTFPSSEKGKGPMGNQGLEDEQRYHRDECSNTEHSPSLGSEGSSNGSNYDLHIDPYSAQADTFLFYTTSPEPSLPEPGNTILQDSYPEYHSIEHCPYYPDGWCHYCCVAAQRPIAGPSSRPGHSFVSAEKSQYPYPLRSAPKVPAEPSSDKSSPRRSASPKSPRRYLCPICRHAFSKQYDLKRHYDTHIPETERLQYTCPDCPQIFYRRDSIIRHRRSQACKKGKDKEQDEPEKRT